MQPRTPAAIAVGLAHVAGRDDLDDVIVMDGDGEDRAEDIPKLVAAAAGHPGHVILPGAPSGRRREHSGWDT